MYDLYKIKVDEKRTYSELKGLTCNLFWLVIVLNTFQFTFKAPSIWIIMLLISPMSHSMSIFVRSVPISHHCQYVFFFFFASFNAWWAMHEISL